MPNPRPQQRKDALQSIMLGHQLDYSFSQLRLLGMLLLVCLALRLVSLVWLGAQGDPLSHLHQIEQASQSLPLLPLAVALVLLGGGRQRLHRELFFVDTLRQVVLPLAMVCLVVFPSLTFIAQDRARNQLQQGEQALAELVARFDRLEEDMDGVQDRAALVRMARTAGLEVPLNLPPSQDQVRRKLRRQMDRDLRAAEKRSAGPEAQMAAQALMPGILFSSVVEQIIAGVALIWMDRQGRRLIRHHGLTMTQFFHSDLKKGRNAG
ncbi:MAG: hypothetical protein ACK5N0_07965 [Synechococcaceae cyanobacterium]